MRIFFLIPGIACLMLFQNNASRLIAAGRADTAIVNHQLDGNITEWPAEKFGTDKQTGIRYATDNDQENLFIALVISDKKIQQRIMQQGLFFYIDTRGKKKETRGVEFPLALVNTAGWNTRKESLTKMKLFGFSKLESFAQDIKTEGTINIATGWDSAYNFHVEYLIPLKILEQDIAGLNNKKINIGWKIKGDESSTTGNTAPASRVVTTLQGRPQGGGAVINRPVSTTTTNQPQQTGEKTSSLWTSHTIIL